MKTLRHIVLMVTTLFAATGALAFDHTHARWNALLAQNVVVNPAGTASTVRYAAIAQQRETLTAYLASLSAVTPAQYAGWSRDERLAFLVNAYNAFTIDLILSRYPKLESIKDLGSFLSSPWKQSFFRLLGKDETLDGIEHGLIRAPGAFDDPRIHAAVVCASIGCPMLRNEAYVAPRLDAQLEDQMQRFLRDRSRNRFDASGNTLHVSKIFDWYGKDFEQGHRGFASLKGTFAHYAAALSDNAEAADRIRQGKYRIDFLDYDWRLNDAR